MCSHPFHSAMTISQAIETLSSIAELEVIDIAYSSKDSQGAFSIPAVFQAVHWLHKKNAEKVMHVVRESFLVILDYLRSHYKTEYAQLVHKEGVENIKTIMVLVGEAAQNFDKYTRVFVGADFQSVRDTKEFRELYSFYQKRIAPIVSEEKKPEWMHIVPEKLALDTMKKKKKLQEHYQTYFLDMDRVRRDSASDLFYIRKESSERFFQKELIRNMQLVGNLEEYAQDKEGLVEAFYTNKDRYLQEIAQKIVISSWGHIDLFFRESAPFIQHETISYLYSSLIALILSARKNRSFTPVKRVADYFRDFQEFFHAACSTKGFQSAITYPSMDAFPLQKQAMQLIERISSALYTENTISPKEEGYIAKFTPKGLPKETLSLSLIDAYKACTKSLEACHYIPLLLNLQAIEQRDGLTFHPLILYQNVPLHFFDIQKRGKRIACSALASPTKQEYIQKAFPSHEYLAFLRTLKNHKKSCLLINLQERGHWRDAARSHALEELGESKELQDTLNIVSLSRNNDFYRQKGSYEESISFERFSEQLLQHVSGEYQECFFSKNIDKKKLVTFEKNLIGAIHRVFFNQKNVLAQKQRRDFIELFYAFLILYLIDTISPDHVEVVSSDGMDTAPSILSTLFVLLRLLREAKLSSEEMLYVETMLFLNAVQLRGRPLKQEAFEDFCSLIRSVELILDDIGIENVQDALELYFIPLFPNGILSSNVEIPTTKEFGLIIESF